MKTLLKRIWSFIRRHPVWSAIGFIGFLILLFIISSVTGGGEPEYLTDTVRKGDLRQTVEAVGEVISERDLQLQFPITGIVDKVLVEEGDRVTAGQELARLRSSGLGADVASASAQVASARADLEQLEIGTRPEEILVTEASVANKRAALEAARESYATAEENAQQAQEKLDALQREVEISLSGFVSTGYSDVTRHLTTAVTAGRVIDDIYADRDFNSAGMKDGGSEYHRLRQNASDAQDSAERTLLSARAPVDYKDSLLQLQEARTHISATSNALNRLYALISGLERTASFSGSDREALKSTVSTQLTAVQSALGSIDSSIKAIQDASANFETRIIAEQAALTTAIGNRNKAEADISTFETSLRIEVAQLNLKRSGSRQTDIDAAKARLNQAYAQLRRANERYADTIIKAPIDGQITKVNLKEGELLSTSFASDAPISMLGDSPYRIEMFISEIDIPKVVTQQSGSVLLDAFSNVDFPLIVSEVDPAATEVDGVSKYRAKLDFVLSQMEEDLYNRLKIGMTGDAEIFTDFREDAVIIPGRAVINDAEKGTIVRVLKEDNEIEERAVATGMEGEGGDIEIITGLEENETIVVLIKD